MLDIKQPKLVALYCCLLGALSCSPAEVPDSTHPSDAADPLTKPEGGSPKSVNSYNIDASQKHSIPREKPAVPYRGRYEFTAENDWFGHIIPVWQVMLDEFRNIPGLSYLEVGCYEGRSSVWMLENILTDRTSRLTCIDPFLEHFGGDIAKQRFNANVRKAGGAGRFDVIVGYSQVELRRLPIESFDLIYIDGDHRAVAVLEDAVLSWGLLKPGGLLIFDDYDWAHDSELADRPLMAIDFFTEVFRLQAEVVHRDYQVILRKNRQ